MTISDLVKALGAQAETAYVYVDIGEEKLIPVSLPPSSPAPPLLLRKKVQLNDGVTTMQLRDRLKELIRAKLPKETEVMFDDGTGPPYALVRGPRASRMEKESLPSSHPLAVVIQA